MSLPSTFTARIKTSAVMNGLLISLVAKRRVLMADRAEFCASERMANVLRMDVGSRNAANRQSINRHRRK
jgi:hypothetical protein